MKLPNGFSPTLAGTEMEIYEAIVRHCAQICAEMYKTPPADFNHFDLAQGWEAALDLAEQRILKEFDLEEKK